MLPLLKLTKSLPYLIGMYGIPLLYGIFLQHAFSGKISKEENPHSNIKKDAISFTGTSVIIAMDEAVLSSGRSILTLGGYMILFNLLNLLPYEAGKLFLLGERLQKGSNSVSLYRIASFTEKICSSLLRNYRRNWKTERGNVSPCSAPTASWGAVLSGPDRKLYTEYGAFPGKLCVAQMYSGAFNGRVLPGMVSALPGKLPKVISPAFPAKFSDILSVR